MSHRRYLVIAFSDLSESTRISAALEPEIYSELLEDFRVIISEIVAKHGGEIIRIDGDGVIYVFGYPDTYEDAGRRATEAALELHNTIDRLQTPHSTKVTKLRMHTGIHSGIVLIRAGDMVRGRFEILGDPTNIAARLCDFAAAGEIIASDETLGADRMFFRTGQPRRINIHGKSENVLVYNVHGKITTPNRYAARMKRGASAFAGRQDELRQLHACRTDAVSKGNQIAIVSGDAGVGKTRLISEFMQEAAIGGFSVHQGYCEAYLSARPLQPFAHLILSILTTEYGLAGEHDAAILRKHISSIDAALTDPIMQILSLSDSRTSGGSPQIQDAMSALLRLLNGVKAREPLIVCIDDWQWADNASVQLLNMLIENLQTPALFVLATRDTDNIDAQMTKAAQITLRPLSADQSKRAIEQQLQSQDPFIVKQIQDLSGGNPLFIEELCHSIRSNAGGLEKYSRSASLQSLIYARFRRLPPEESKLVKTASVIGHMIPIWLLQKICSTTIDHAALSSLSEKDFIHGSDISGMLRFKHGITRDVVYESIDFKERQRMHQAIVEALHMRTETHHTEDMQHEALAFHYGQCGNSDRAIHYAILAGDNALKVSALDRAQAHYRDALDKLMALEDRPEKAKLINTVVRKFGLACVVDPSRDQLSVLQAAAENAASLQDVNGEVWAEYWLGFILYGLGEPNLSIRHLEKARTRAETLTDDKLLIQIQANLGQSHATACEYEPALDLLDRAINIKRAHRSGARPSIGLSYSLSCKAFVLADQAKFNEAYQCFDDAVDALGGVEHEMLASILTQRSASCLWHGRTDEAIELAEQARDVAERAKARYLFVMSLALAAAARLQQSNNQDALQVLLETTEWLETSARQQFVSLNYGWLAAALVQSQNYQLARRHAAHAVGRARKGDRLGEAMAYRAAARAASAQFNQKHAKRYLKRAYQSADIRNSPHERAKTLICEAEISARNRDAERTSFLLKKAQSICSVFKIETQVPNIDVIMTGPNRLLL